jgi:type II secretory ATPase GspE/PulE/Tfp pilus assembly ATPase PilB-like protein
MLEMGIEDYLLASALQGVIAQRLVRVLCPECKQSYTPKTEELSFAPEGRKVDKLYQAQGCEECSQIGFQGRTSIYELLPFDKELEFLVTQHENINELRNKADKKGYKTLFEAGWRKVEAGVTTLDEVLRVTKS